MKLSTVGWGPGLGRGTAAAAGFSQPPQGVLARSSKPRASGGGTTPKGAIENIEWIRPLTKGFTLIEILIVITILGILAALTIPRLAGKTEEARIQASHAEIEGGLGIALDLYEVDMGRYPTALDDLIRKPADSSRWKGPYLKKGRIPMDPWKNPYLYRYPGTQGPDYDLWSSGPDGIEGNEDDIANWKE